jgi:F-type H+-transporting ATPase subunit a
MAGHSHSPMDHVMDEPGGWTIFTDLFGGLQIPLLDLRPHGIPFTLTKFMVMELIAAGLICAIFIPLARRAAAGGAPKGAWWNAFESLLTFIRDQVARPSLAAPEDHHDAAHAAEHGAPAGAPHGAAAAAHAPDHTAPHARPAPDYDAYVPFLWTVFLFILFCNLLGMLPFMGSPTASILVTGALALCSFVMMHGAAIVRMGFVPYAKSLWPAMDVPFPINIFLKPMILIIELFGTVIKAIVLAVRLFANMFAGHMVLAMILFFIVQTANSVLLWGGVTVASVLGVTALSLLELFVAFLQAYIFTFLTALFMGMALHPQH